MTTGRLMYGAQEGPRRKNIGVQAVNGMVRMILRHPNGSRSSVWMTPITASSIGPILADAAFEARQQREARSKR